MLDTLVYLFLVALWSAIIAYIILFRILPHASKAGKHSVAHVSAAVVDTALVDRHAPMTAPPSRQEVPQRRQFSSYEGFKSFAEGAELTVEDIVRGLSRRG